MTEALLLGMAPRCRLATYQAGLGTSHICCRDALREEACELFTQATVLSPGKHFGHDNINRIGEVTALET